MGKNVCDKAFIIHKLVIMNTDVFNTRITALTHYKYNFKFTIHPRAEQIRSTSTISLQCKKN